MTKTCQLWCRGSSELLEITWPLWNIRNGCVQSKRPFWSREITFTFYGFHYRLRQIIHQVIYLLIYWFRLIFLCKSSTLFTFPEMYLQILKTTHQRQLLSWPPSFPSRAYVFIQSLWPVFLMPSQPLPEAQQEGPKQQKKTHGRMVDYSFPAKWNWRPRGATPARSTWPSPLIWLCCCWPLMSLTAWFISEVTSTKDTQGICWVCERKENNMVFLDPIMC